jgi:hypothetical protein
VTPASTGPVFSGEPRHAAKLALIVRNKSHFDCAGVSGNSEVVIADHLTSAFYGWSIEVTFAEVRRHRGVESQRRWSDLAICRTTSALFGLFSLVTLWAGEDAPFL